MRVCVVLLCVLLCPVARAEPRPPAIEEADRLLREAYQISQMKPEFMSRLARALALYEQAYGKDDPRVAKPLESLGKALLLIGDGQGAVRAWERLVTLREKDKGPDSLAVGNDLSMLCSVYAGVGKHKEAEAAMQRALPIFERHDTPKNPVLVGFLISMAFRHTGQEDYAAAQPLLERARQHAESRGDRDRLYEALSSLAYTCSMRGLHAEAERHYRQVLALQEQRKELDAAVSTLMQIAVSIEAQGKAAEARAMWERTESAALDRLRFYEQKHAQRLPNNEYLSRINDALGLLAGIYTYRGLLDQRIPILHRILANTRDEYGKDSLQAASQESSLADAYRKKGDFDRARALLTRAHQAQLRIIGASNLYISLEGLEHDAGNFAAARRWLLVSERDFQNRYGLSYPVANSRLRDARLWRAEGKPRQALVELRRSLEIMEPHVALVLGSGTEADKRRFLDGVAYQVHDAVALHAQALPQEREGLELALTTVLRRKGLALDAMSEGIDALRRRLGEGDRALLDRLAEARAALSRLLLQPQGEAAPYLQRVAALERTVRELEQSLFQRRPDVKAAEGAQVTIGAVQAALPAGSALIEIFALQPPNVRRGDPRGDPALRRYVAYVVPPKGAPAWAELGLLKDVDPAVERLREALSSPYRGDVKQLARALGDRVMRPLLPLIGGARHLFLAPDGALNLVPFAALVDGQGRFLLQQHTLSYLSSGRDLVRLRTAAAPRGKPALLANPDFSGAPAAGASPAAGRRSASLLASDWAPLPATEEEARAIAPLLDGAAVLTGAQATEAALKALGGPQVLHVATHGFFLPAPPAGPQGGQTENPLLRSGLLLSGANHRASGAEDGVLTALEASGLDLGGTQLVVLSACETGLGQVHSGEGVYGLRRALAIAGAEAQVMSLWQVDDNATRDLMTGMYRRLRDGNGRAEALRQAQLRMLQSPETQHPYYWASFIAAGAWGPLRKAQPSP